MQTLLQKIATQRDWFNTHEVRPILTTSLRELQLSSRTIAHIAAINNDKCKLKELVDRDWEAQRKKIKKDQLDLSGIDTRDTSIPESEL